MEFTTIEKLQLKVSASYGAVLKYGDRVFVTDISWKGGFTAEIYEFVETPEETGFGDIECRLHLIDKADSPSRITDTPLRGAFQESKNNSLGA